MTTYPADLRRLRSRRALDAGGRLKTTYPADLAAPTASRDDTGHETVGRAVDRGPAAKRFELGARVGVAWLRPTCGRCRWCRRGRENLCPWSAYSGWDADGGFAPICTVPAAFG